MNLNLGHNTKYYGCHFSGNNLFSTRNWHIYGISKTNSDIYKIGANVCTYNSKNRTFHIFFICHFYIWPWMIILVFCQSQGSWSFREITDSRKNGPRFLNNFFFFFERQTSCKLFRDCWDNQALIQSISTLCEIRRTYTELTNSVFALSLFSLEY